MMLREIEKDREGMTSNDNVDNNVANNDHRHVAVVDNENLNSTSPILGFVNGQENLENLIQVPHTDIEYIDVVPNSTNTGQEFDNVMVDNSIHDEYYQPESPDHVSNSISHHSVSSEAMQSTPSNYVLNSVSSHEREWSNNIVAHDRKIVGGLWSNDDNEEDGNSKEKTEEPFSVVLTKSQKKKQRKAKQQAQKAEQYNTRYKDGTNKPVIRY